MVIMAEEQGFEKEELISKETTLDVKDLVELEPKIKLLFDEEYRQKLIKNGTKFVNQYFVNQGTAARKLAELIDQSINSK